MPQPDDALLTGLQTLLDDLDDADGGEDVEELNATLEDVLLLLEEILPDDPSAEEELADASACLKDLVTAYAKYPDLLPFAERLNALLAGAHLL